MVRKQTGFSRQGATDAALFRVAQVVKSDRVVSRISGVGWAAAAVQDRPCVRNEQRESADNTRTGYLPRDAGKGRGDIWLYGEILSPDRSAPWGLGFEISRAS
jgi:hypothetical protein